MTKFDKAQFDCHGGYLTYGPERKFVARSKYRATDLASIRSFLIKHFSVEEYFARHAAGEAPLTILESKGYLLPHIRRWLKSSNAAERAAGEQYVARLAKLNAAGAA